MWSGFKKKAVFGGSGGITRKRGGKSAWSVVGVLMPKALGLVLKKFVSVTW